MFSDIGKTFIYMVHGNWLLNIVAHPKGEVGAVLIRAIEPIQGMEMMWEKRRVRRERDLTRGPGRLTKALDITKKLNEIDVTKEDGELLVAEGREENFEIGTSKRIGVKTDLPKELRFFIEGSKFASN